MANCNSRNLIGSSSLFLVSHILQENYLHSDLSSRESVTANNNDIILKYTVFLGCSVWFPVVFLQASFHLVSLERYCQRCQRDKKCRGDWMWILPWLWKISWLWVNTDETVICCICMCVCWAICLCHFFNNSNQLCPHSKSVSGAHTATQSCWTQTLIKAQPTLITVILCWSAVYRFGKRVEKIYS